MEIWQMARQQCQDIYKIFSVGKLSRDYALKNQITAAAGSVMDNIAEGFERSGSREFINFLVIAKASNGEVRSQLIRVADCLTINQESHNLIIEKNKLLSCKITAFIKYLKLSERKGFRYE